MLLTSVLINSAPSSVALLLKALWNIKGSIQPSILLSVYVAVSIPSLLIYGKIFDNSVPLIFFVPAPHAL